MTLITRSVAILTFIVVSITSSADTLRIGLPQIGESMDYRFTNEAAAYRVIRMLSSGILKYVDEDVSFGRVLDKTAKTITLRLNEAYFTDGERLKAHHIKTMYLDLQNNPKITRFKKDLEKVTAIDILDDYTIKFTFSEIDNFKEGKFAVPIFKQEGNDLIGLGPYVIEEFEFPYKLTLKAVDDGLHYQKIEFVPNLMPVVRIIQLMKGEVDVLHSDISPSQIRMLEKKGFKVASADSASYSLLGFNLKDDTVKDANFRKAIAYAIDIDSIIKYLYAGFAKKAGSLLTPGNEFFKENFIEYNPKKAVELLEELGYKPDKNGVRVKINFSINNDNQTIRFAQVLQDQLKEVGIEINLIVSDWGRFVQDIDAGNYQMYSISWVGVFDGEIYKKFFHTESIGESGFNYSFYSDPEMDKMIDLITKTNLSYEDTKKTIFAIQDKQLDDMICIPLWKKKYVLVYKPDIKEYLPSSTGGFESIKQIKKN